MRWITRERPKIDRVACPWLVRRFIDPQAEFLFVPPERVREMAAETGATPFDVEGVELSHDGPRCSFDAFLDKYGLYDPHLRGLAIIVRGADTDRLDLSPQCAGLLAISLGLSNNFPDDRDDGGGRSGFGGGGGGRPRGNNSKGSRRGLRARMGRARFLLGQHWQRTCANGGRRVVAPSVSRTEPGSYGLAPGRPRRTGKRSPQPWATS